MSKAVRWNIGQRVAPHLEPGEELVAGCFVSPRGAGLAFAGQMVGGVVPGAVGSVLGTVAGHVVSAVTEVAVNLAAPDGDTRGRLLASVFSDKDMALALSPSYLHLLDAGRIRAKKHRARVPARFLHTATWVKTSTVFHRMELVLVDGSGVVLELPRPRASKNFVEQYNAVAEACRRAEATSELGVPRLG